MAIELEDLAGAINMLSAILDEHAMQPHEYMGLSDQVRDLLRRMISSRIDIEGVPRSRHAYHSELLKHTEIGMLLGVKLSRSRMARGD